MALSVQAASRGRELQAPAGQSGDEGPEHPGDFVEAHPPGPLARALDEGREVLQLGARAIQALAVVDVDRRQQPALGPGVAQLADRARGEPGELVGELGARLGAHPGPAQDKVLQLPRLSGQISRQARRAAVRRQHRADQLVEPRLEPGRAERRLSGADRRLRIPS